MLTSSMRFWFPFSIIVLLVISFMSNDLFIPSMPQLTEYYNVSANVIQNSIAAWFFGSMSLQIILGPLSDHYGRRPILLLSGILLALASLMCAYSETITLFLTGRFFQGVAVSGIMVTAFAALHEVYEKEENATKMFGYVGMSTALSPLAGPLIGGYIAAFFGWKANFYSVAIFGVILIALLYKYMPETVTQRYSRIQLKQVIGHYKTLLANRTFVTTVSCYGMLFFAGGAFLAVAPFIYINLLGMPAEYIGYGMMPMFICYMLASGLAGKLEKRFAANKIVGNSLAALSVIMVGFIFGSSHAENSAIFIISGIALYYVGLGLIGPPLNHISLSQATTENKGSASALLTIIMMLGSAIGASAISVFYDGHLLPIAIVMAGSIFVAASAFLLYVTDKSLALQRSEGHRYQ